MMPRWDAIESDAVVAVRTACRMLRAATPAHGPGEAKAAADPCQGLRDALATAQGALAVLQTATQTAESVVTILEMQLMDCETNQ